MTESVMAKIARLVQQDPQEEIALLRKALENLVFYPPAMRGRKSGHEAARAYVLWDDVEVGRELLRQTGPQSLDQDIPTTPDMAIDGNRDSGLT